MVEKKSQHFVPQFYLRNFSIDADKRRVRGFNLNSLAEIPSAKLRSQCAKGYFYGKDLKIENILGKLEGVFAKVIKDTIDEPVDVSDTQKYLLRLFSVLQYLRTDALVEDNNEAFKWMGQALEGTVEGLELKSENQAASNILHSVYLAHEASDLKVQVLQASRDSFFITSDNPSVKFNKFSAQNFSDAVGVGFGSVGFCIWVPLSFTVGVLVYDPTVYALRARLTKKPVLQKKDVDSLNQIVILNAQNMLYFSASQDLPALRKLIDASAEERAKAKSIITYLRETDQRPNGEKVYTAIVDDQTGKPVTEPPQESCLVHSASYQRKPKSFPQFLKTKVTAKSLTSSDECPRRKRGKFYYTAGFEALESRAAIERARPFDSRPLKLTPLE